MHTMGRRVILPFAAVVVLPPKGAGVWQPSCCCVSYVGLVLVLVLVVVLVILPVSAATSRLVLAEYLLELRSCMVGPPSTHMVSLLASLLAPPHPPKETVKTRSKTDCICVPRTRSNIRKSNYRIMPTQKPMPIWYVIGVQYISWCCHMRRDTALSVPMSPVCLATVLVCDLIVTASAWLHHTHGSLQLAGIAVHALRAPAPGRG